MRTTLLLWAYRQVLALSLLTCHGLAALVLLGLLAAKPVAVLYLLDLVSPITEVVRDALWGLFPEAEWLRKAGQWMGAVVRKGFSLTQARHEAIGRLLLLDGLLLLTLMAWALNKVLGLLVTLKVARWFNSRYVILKREDFERLLKRQDAQQPPTRLPEAKQIQPLRAVR